MNRATPIIIPGPYKLEGLLSLTDVEPKGLALICHPHPLYQGTMHNKVVTTLARAAAECGYASLRFNFRGVGNSEGRYGKGIGELEDAKAALEYLLNTLSPSPTSKMSTLPQGESEPNETAFNEEVRAPAGHRLSRSDEIQGKSQRKSAVYTGVNEHFEAVFNEEVHAPAGHRLSRSDEIQGKSQRKSAVYTGVNEHFEAVFNEEVRASRKPVIIMGFSFGGYIAAELAAQMNPPPHGLITIAPALHYENLQVSQTPQCPWLVVHGDSDEVIRHDDNKIWLEEKAPEAQLVSMSGASHFFHGKLVELQKVVVDFIAPSPKAKISTLPRERVDP